MVVSRRRFLKRTRSQTPPNDTVEEPLLVPIISSAVDRLHHELKPSILTSDSKVTDLRTVTIAQNNQNVAAANNSCDVKSVILFTH